MTITADPSVREVLTRVVEDPRYPAIAHKPLISWPHIGLVGFCYGLFAFSAVAYLTGAIPFLVMLLLSSLAIFVSFSPEHDAVHGAVSSNERVNNAIGTVSIALLVPGLSTTIYRTLHMEHHRWVGDPERDPDDIFVKAPRPLLPLVLMAPLEIWAVWYLRRLWHRRPLRERLLFVFNLSVYVAITVAFLLSPWAWEFILVWLIPQKVAVSWLVYSFAHIQHPEGASWQDSPFQSTVRVRSGRLAKIFMLGQTDHCIHHALPHIPLHRYHRIWELSDSALEAVDIPERGLFRGVRSDAVLPVVTDVRVPARVAAVRPVGGAGVVSFDLEGVDGALPEFTPGSHIDVFLPSGRIRQYSLCNAPGEGRYRIAVKPEPEGRGGSMEVHETLRPGAVVTIGQPRNNFHLVPARRYVLVAGGIGITPLLSMAHQLWREKTPFALHVCAAEAAAVPFGAELAALPFAESINVHVDRAPGRSSLDPDRALAGWEAGTELYVCGPAGFMDWVTGSALDRTWPLDAVHRESFTAPVVDPTENRSFDLVLARRGRQLHVPADRAILDVLTDNDIRVPYACAQGVCGRCITPVLEGEVDHRDAVLSPEVRAQNSCMALCVSRARGGQVTLDL